MQNKTNAYLSIGVFDGRDVALAERPFDEPQHQGALPDAPGSKNHHPVVVALLGHGFIYN